MKVIISTQELHECGISVAGQLQTGFIPFQVASCVRKLGNIRWISSHASSRWRIPQQWRSPAPGLPRQNVSLLIWPHLHHVITFVSQSFPPWFSFMCRAKTSPSWIFEYWITAAYLANREPLACEYCLRSNCVMPQVAWKSLISCVNLHWGSPSRQDLNTEESCTVI